MNSRYSIVDASGELISDKWFNWVYDFKDGLIEVMLNSKYSLRSDGAVNIDDEWRKLKADEDV